MKKLLLMSAAASLLATAAFAQTTVTTTTGTAGATVQIEPQYRTKIKSYVTEHKIRPVTTKEKTLTGVRLSPSIAMCIRVAASCWSNRVAGPSFRKSTDSFARSGALEGFALRWVVSPSRLNRTAPLGKVSLLASTGTLIRLANLSFGHSGRAH